MMIFRAIRLCNYGIYAGTHEVRPVWGPPGSKNITLIGGLNGRGKTSLLDAVLLALYGNRSPSIPGRMKYERYLQSLIHKGAPRGAVSFVELEIDLATTSENLTLLIRRSWPAPHGRSPDLLEIWKNGVSDPTLAANWHSSVEELVPSGLAGLFFFDGEKIAQIADADETSHELRQSIRALLGLDLVDRLIADLNIVIRNNQDKLRDDKARDEIERLQQEGEKLQEQITVKKQEVAALRARIKRIEGLLEDKEGAFYEQGGGLAENREALLASEAGLTAKIHQYKEQALELAAGPLPLLITLPLLQQIARSVRQEDMVMEAKSSLNLLEERDRRLLNHLRTLSGAENLVQAVHTWLSRDRQDLENLSQKPVIFCLSRTGKNQLYQLLDGIGEELLRKTRELQEEVVRTEYELAQVRDHLLVGLDQNVLTTLYQEIKELNEELTALKIQFDAQQRELLTLERQLDHVMRQLSKRGERLGHELDAERIVRYASKTQEIMRIFRQRATERKVGRLTKHIKEAFDVLTHKDTLVDHLVIDPESLRITLFDNRGRELPRSRLSSGEKQMLAISILWGLARASGRALPVIIDTPLGRLDSSHRMNFVSKYLPNASHQVMVLSTDTEIVGPYLESLSDKIGRTYLLKYDETRQCTEVQEGYFDTAGSIAQ